MIDLQEEYQNLLVAYESIKKVVRQKDNHLYERWKAGGFCIDQNILSMYPNLSEVIQELEDKEEVEEEGGD